MKQFLRRKSDNLQRKTAFNCNQFDGFQHGGLEIAEIFREKSREEESGNYIRREIALVCVKCIASRCRREKWELGGVLVFLFGAMLQPLLLCRLLGKWMKEGDEVCKIAQLRACERRVMQRIWNVKVNSQTAAWLRFWL